MKLDRVNLIGGLRFAVGDKWVFLGEERHPHPDFFLILFYNRLQERKQFLVLFGVFLDGYLVAKLAH